MERSKMARNKIITEAKEKLFTKAPEKTPMTCQWVNESIMDEKKAAEDYKKHGLEIARDEERHAKLLTDIKKEMGCS